jgi:hypothetical protein
MSPRPRSIRTAHIVASLAVVAVMAPTLLHSLSARGQSSAMQIVGLLLAVSLAPLWVPALLLAAPIYAIVKGIVPSHWLAIEWATYVIAGMVTLAIRRRGESSN